MERSCTIDAPIAEVFAFHLDTRNAARIAPPGQQVLSVEGTFPLRLDSEVRLRVRQLPSPWAQTWLVRVVQLEEPTLIVDEMLRGPFPAWRHEHRFAELPDGRTRLTDHVEYRLPAGALRTGRERAPRPPDPAGHFSQPPAAHARAARGEVSRSTLTANTLQ